MSGHAILGIDAVVNYEFADPELERKGWQKSFITGKIGADEGLISGLTPEALIEKMDRAGLEHCFLLAIKAGSAQHRINRRVPYEAVAEVVRRHPKRFSGLAGVPVDPASLTAGGIIAVVIAAVLALVGAVLGGLVGMRYHRRVDRYALGTPPVQGT